MARKKSDLAEDNDFEFIADEEILKTEKQNKQKPEIKERVFEKENQEILEGGKPAKHTCNCDDKPCEKCKDYLAKADEYKKLLQLTQADFDNYRKRSFTLMQSTKLDGELNVIRKFLPSLDAFDKAMEMITDANSLKGVEMIYNQIMEGLKNIGVSEINPLGELFDPNFHNAISVSYDESKKEDIVTQVYQKGYIYNDKVIRYAQVITNKNK